MRWPVAAVLVALSAVTPRNAAVDSPRPAQESATPAMRKPVLVELFTSEGCSTCPPADALLVRLETEQPIPGVQVIAIEEHVDYWNQQGWNDPFSSSEWTLRQQDYGSKFKLPAPYTPQLIVDGETQLVGGRQGETQEAIRQAAQQQKAEVTLMPRKPSADGTDLVEVRVDKLPQPRQWRGPHLARRHREGSEILRQRRRKRRKGSAPRLRPAGAPQGWYSGRQISFVCSFAGVEIETQLESRQSYNRRICPGQTDLAYSRGRGGQAPELSRRQPSAGVFCESCV